MPMTGGIPVEQRIDAIDVFARTLYLRTKQDPDQAEVSDAVRQLHTGLRHLRVEAADRDSLLCDPSSVYSSQVYPLVEDCARTLRLLEHALNDEGRGLTSVKAQLKGRKATIDSFLDAVQLQNPRSRPGKSVVDTAQPGLDSIKDKVDQVAEKIFRRKSSGFGDGDDSLWKEFQSELEGQGFDPAVLRQHKDVLRAYIRSLQSMSHNNDSPPTLQGLLKYEEKTGHRPSDEKEVVPRSPVDDPKYTVEPEAIGPKAKDSPPPLPPKIPLTENLPEPVAELPSSPSSSNRSSPSNSMTLISTKDLLAMDSLDSDMARLHLHKHHHHHHSHDTRGHSPSDGRKGRETHRESSSRLNLPENQDSSALYGSSPLIAPPRAYHSLGSSPSNPGMAHHFRLAPDRYGRPIPHDAEWTKINRDLVSPQVLEKARVRYEARPKYVAILGHLSKEQIADFVRQTTDVRAARNIRQNQRADSRSSRDDDDDDDDDSDKFSDDSDTTDIDDDKTSDKGTKSYPFIVSPPEKTSPSSTVAPKSILKNKQNHVHFADSGDSDSHTSRSLRDEKSRSDDHHRRSRRESDNYGSRDYQRESSDRSSHHSSSKRHSPPDDRDRYYRSRRYSNEERDSHYDRDSHHSSSSRYRDSGSRHHRDRESESRKKKNKALGETLGAVGIGGAAVSLLSVLAEAAI